MKAHLQSLVRECSPLQGRNLVREYLQARILGAPDWPPRMWGHFWSVSPCPRSQGTRRHTSAGLRHLMSDLAIKWTYGQPNLRSSRLRFNVGPYAVGFRRQLGTALGTALQRFHRASSSPTACPSARLPEHPKLGRGRCRGRKRMS